MTAAIDRTRWGCTANPDYRKPRHLLDHDRARRTGELVALCGEFLHYIDGAIDVRGGDLCSGRQMLAERARSCRTCLRREAERLDASSMVTMPLGAVVNLASNDPAFWAQVSSNLDPSTVAVVNSML